MKTSTQKRIARFSRLLVLSLLLVALAVPAAQAMRDFASGTGGSSTSAVTGTPNDQQRPTLAQLQRAHGGHGLSLGSGAGTVGAGQPASSGTSSTTIGIAVGAAVAVLIIALVAWALISRRRRPGVPESSAYCAQHPGDSLCRAA